MFLHGEKKNKNNQGLHIKIELKRSIHQSPLDWALLNYCLWNLVSQCRTAVIYVWYYPQLINRLEKSLHNGWEWRQLLNCESVIGYEERPGVRDKQNIFWKSSVKCSVVVLALFIKSVATTRFCHIHTYIHSLELWSKTVTTALLWHYFWNMCNLKVPKIVPDFKLTLLPIDFYKLSGTSQ